MALGAAVFLVLLLAWLAPALAQQGTPPIQRSYINPFPTGDRYRVVVLGDSLGDGLWSGLYRAFEGDATLEFINRAKPSTGFARPDSYDWSKGAGDLLKSETYQIAIIMFGANDAQAIKSGKEWLKVGSEGWHEVYGQRVEAFIKKLRAANVAVYWVGLPIMRSPGQNSDAEALNQAYREKAFINGAKFIDTWNGFTDEGGRYSAYGPDMTGQVKRLRADDGIHFTMRGYLKLAHFVEKDLRRDLSLAKLERNIPLAGNEEEQAKVMGREVVPGRSDPPQPGAPPPEPQEVAAADPNAAAPASPEAPQGEQVQGDQPPQLQQSNVGDVSLVRPAIDQSLQAAQGLTPQGTASSMPEAEMITSELNTGLTAVATISSLTDLSLASSKPRLPLSQRPYYKVLIKGEQLEPKAGRADDFAWPPG
ncbi:MAG TPA: SGNH family hydrolase [Methyloceanibacter sp.]|nr:SGNH family hydrolase [Methyloceanibacter sp.]